MKKLLAMLLVAAMVFSMAACQPAKPAETTGPKGTEGPGDEIVVEKFNGDFIYKDAVVTLAANWNPHTYQSEDEGYPLDFITCGLYAFMYNDELHPAEGKDPYAGYVIVPELAAELPVDVTEKVRADHPEFGIPEDVSAGFAYTVDLNPDAKFDNGKVINAETYVESMKRMLDPKLMNYRAEDMFNGSFVIAGAENYVRQGTSQMMDDASIVIADLVKQDDGTYVTADGEPVYVAVSYPIAYFEGDALADYVEAYGNAYFDVSRWEELKALQDDEGLAPLTDDSLAMLTTLITGNEAWGESEADLPNYIVYKHEFPADVDFSTVGLYASGEYQITFVLKNSLSGFYLTYSAGILTLPLVDTELYDSCLKETDGVWTSTYCTSKETSVSYGPYKISDYQTDKGMHFVRNENWFGYSDGKHIYKDPTDGKYYPMYQTTEIDTQVVSESSTRKMMFLKGQLMGYGLGKEDFETYRNSEYTYATPAVTLFFMILNGHLKAMQTREAAADFDQKTTDLETISLTSFRKAMAVTYDRDLFCSTISPARAPGYGIIGSLYLYDVDSGARYRDTDQAKQILCDFYSVDTSKYANLDDAVASITGYDPVAAKKLFNEAFEEAIEKGYITDEDGDGISDQTVTLTYSLSEDSDFMTQTIDYLNEKVNEVTKDTAFDGKIKFVKSAPLGSPGWSNSIKEGSTDIVLGGWNGDPLDPFSLTAYYTDPSFAYDGAWFDATKVNMTLNVNVAGVDGNDVQEVTMTLAQWSKCLNGESITVDGKSYNFGDGQTDIDTRLSVLAAIEGEILKTYNYLPMMQNASMAMLSQQVYYVVEEYSPIMSRGGIRYMKYNYNEADWAAYVASQGGELKY